MKISRLCVFVFLSIAVIGCSAATSSNSTRRWMAKELGSRQCQPVQNKLARAREELLQAGVNPFEMRCAYDGNSYLTVCGGPDGALAAALIDTAASAKAERIGYLPLQSFPGASFSACE